MYAQLIRGDRGAYLQHRLQGLASQMLSCPIEHPSLVAPTPAEDMHAFWCHFHNHNTDVLPESFWPTWRASSEEPGGQLSCALASIA